MKPRHALTLSVLLGAALGAAAIQGLHAQIKRPAYVVVVIRNVGDVDGMKTVAEKTKPEALAAAGGRYVIRTNDITALNGNPPKRYVLIAFDSIEQAQAWHNSPAQKEIDALRIKSADSVSFMVEGVAN